MMKQLLTPDYIFESSWEVCNKVGGIYTVLSTRAKTLQNVFPDRIFFIGPDVWLGKENPLFTENTYRAVEYSGASYCYFSGFYSVLRTKK